MSKIRSSMTSNYVAGVCCLAIVAQLLFSAQGVHGQTQTPGVSTPENLRTLRSYAGAFSGFVQYLNNTGVDINISNQLAGLEDKIKNDLNYAANGGVLVVARLEAFRNDAGTFRSLVSDRVDYVGIGSTPAEAELAGISKPQDPFYNVQRGKSLDADASTAYWFRKGNDGSISVTHQPLSWLRREVAVLFAERQLGDYDWAIERHREFDRLIGVASQLVSDRAVAAEVEKLARGRQAALSQLKELNRELKEAQERATRAGANGTLLKILGLGAQFAQIIHLASEGLGSADAQQIKIQTTPEGVAAELDAITKRAQSDARRLMESQRVKSSELNLLDFSIQWKLRKNNVPVDNLPPSQEPLINRRY